MVRPQFDVFNGDADGLCALVQLRLAMPREAVLVTGVKRDIALLKQVPVDQPVTVTALDISLDKNREAVDSLLAAGSSVFYCDHHFPGDSLPQNANFTAEIDTDATTCTSLIVDRLLGGRYHNWAITAAFGDNLVAVAEDLADRARLSAEDTADLKQLGICLNYNGYGATTDDLLFHPAELYQQIQGFEDPLDLMREQSECWQKLHKGYQQDMARGLAAEAIVDETSAYVVSLPNEAWSRRVSGVLGNELANKKSDAACAVLTDIGDDSYLVSVRAPLSNRTGADELVRQFATGGGRKAAAGINKLPKSELDRFLAALKKQWG